MSSCAECLASTETDGLSRIYNAPKCMYCAARLIQQIAKLSGPPREQIIARRRVVMADAVAYGHAESEIRALVETKLLAVEPAQQKEKNRKP